MLYLFQIEVQESDFGQVRILGHKLNDGSLYRFVNYLV